MFDLKNTAVATVLTFSSIVLPSTFASACDTPESKSTADPNIAHTCILNTFQNHANETNGKIYVRYLGKMCGGIDGTPFESMNIHYYPKGERNASTDLSGHFHDVENPIAIISTVLADKTKSNDDNKRGVYGTANAHLDFKDQKTTQEFTTFIVGNSWGKKKPEVPEYDTANANEKSAMDTSQKLADSILSCIGEFETTGAGTGNIKKIDIPVHVRGKSIEFHNFIYENHVKNLVSPN